MLYFKCRISYNELLSLKKNLPDDGFCITRDAHDDYHVGVIPSSMFDKLIGMLSGETLVDLEYLSRDEFLAHIGPIKNNHAKFHGNTALLN